MLQINDWFVCLDYFISDLFYYDKHHPDKYVINQSTSSRQIWNQPINIIQTNMESTNQHHAYNMDINNQQNQCNKEKTNQHHTYNKETTNQHHTYNMETTQT